MIVSKKVGTTSYEEKVWVFILDGKLQKICNNKEHAKDTVRWYKSCGHKAAYALAMVIWEEEEQ